MMRVSLLGEHGLKEFLKTLTDNVIRLDVEPSKAAGDITYLFIDESWQV